MFQKESKAFDLPEIFAISNIEGFLPNYDASKNNKRSGKIRVFHGIVKLDILPFESFKMALFKKGYKVSKSPTHRSDLLGVKIRKF